MNIVEIMIAVLAVWRVSSLLVNEVGPFDVFERVRAWAGIYRDRGGLITADNMVGRILLCLWCTSLWVSIPFALILFPEHWLLYTLALSAGAIFVEGVIARVA